LKLYNNCSSLRVEGSPLSPPPHRAGRSWGDGLVAKRMVRPGDGPFVLLSDWGDGLRHSSELTASSLGAENSGSMAHGWRWVGPMVWSYFGPRGQHHFLC